jgi:hypothetical protein
VLVCDVGEPPVEFELYVRAATSNVNVAESAVVVFPAAVLLLQEVVAEPFDGGVERLLLDGDMRRRSS